MMVVERAALRRVTIVVSMRSWSSGKLVNSGTAFKTAVETVVAIGEFAPSLCKSMLAESRLYNFYPDVSPPDAPLPPSDSRLRPRRVYRGRLCGPCKSQARADRRHRTGRATHDDDRRRQLACRRRRRAGTRSDGALPQARRALRDGNRPRPHP